MPIENAFVYYPRRAAEFFHNFYQWASHVRRFLAIKQRVKADPSALHYTDEALTPPKADQNDNFVEVFAAKIPKTHGAPKRQAVAAIEAAE
jgi:hypothetical protein